MSNPWERFAWSALDAPRVLVEQAPLEIQVAWLEDTQLRRWEPDAREALKQGDQAAVRAYLRDAVQCPYSFDAEPDLVRQFLLSKAVECAFVDELADEGANASAVAGAPIVAELLALSDEIASSAKAGTRQDVSWTTHEAFETLRQELGLPGGSPQEVLRTAAHWAETCWPSREQWLVQYTDDAETVATTGAASPSVPMSSTPMTSTVEGSDVSVLPLLERVRTFARQLHTKELVHVQRLMNTSIERAQGFTANPRTEARLGRVGR
ncbi:hypothetical protein F1559_003728 [Cyanidiococcus yangmingshanensis]|uniref:Uncharacterized protein n=1 Tax=Cyanidiococcus yangmingshanensis TaxID=2690220 RepID=A0A7J7IH69_9RHOD|nr:hypothetical protein F1559_003728 [Cyanidiococcus yangmingshanensis]